MAAGSDCFSHIRTRTTCRYLLHVQVMFKSRNDKSSLPLAVHHPTFDLLDLPMTVNQIYAEPHRSTDASSTDASVPLPYKETHMVNNGSKGTPSTY